MCGKRLWALPYTLLGDSGTISEVVFKICGRLNSIDLGVQLHALACGGIMKTGILPEKSNLE